MSFLVSVFFSNGLVRTEPVPLARAVALHDRHNVIVPPDADLVEIKSPNSSLLIPCQMIVNVDKALVPPRVPLINRHAIYDRDGGKCAYCKKYLDRREATMDHIVPSSKGGQTEWTNIVLCCTECNTRKGDRTPSEARMTLHNKPYVPKVRLRQISQP